MNYFSLTLIRAFLPLLMVCFYQLNLAYARGLLANEEFEFNDELDHDNYSNKEDSKNRQPLTTTATMSIDMNQETNNNSVDSEMDATHKYVMENTPFSINTNTLERLAEDVSFEMMPELIRAFIEELDTRIDVVSSTQLTNNESHIRTQVHSIKSCARTFGATVLADKAAHVEQMIDANVSGIEIQIHQLVALLPIVKLAFTRYLNDLQVD